MQIAVCKASTNRHRLLASFYDLLDIAANHSRRFRGYLLDEQFEPASINRIACWVGLNVTECGEILKELEQIGLIIKVFMPKEFDPALNELPQKPSEEPKETRGKKSGSRARSRKSEKSRAPLKKHKVKSGSGNGNINKKTKSGKEPDKDKTPEKEKAKQKTTAQAISEGLKQKQDDPRNPKVSDAGVGNDKTGQGTDPPRKSFTRGEPKRLDTVLHKLFNPDAQEFAHAVYKAIGTPYPLDSQEARSELACWKQAWAEAQLAGIGPSYLQELWNRTIAEARKLRRKRQHQRFKKSPEAVLRDLFKKLLNATKKKAEQAGQEQLRVISSG